MQFHLKEVETSIKFFYSFTWIFNLLFIKSIIYNSSYCHNQNHRYSLCMHACILDTVEMYHYVNKRPQWLIMNFMSWIFFFALESSLFMRPLQRIKGCLRKLQHLKLKISPYSFLPQDTICGSSCGVVYFDSRAAHFLPYAKGYYNFQQQTFPAAWANWYQCYCQVCKLYCDSECGTDLFFFFSFPFFYKHPLSEKSRLFSINRNSYWIILQHKSIQSNLSQALPFHSGHLLPLQPVVCDMLAFLLFI